MDAANVDAVGGQDLSPCSEETWRVRLSWNARFAVISRAEAAA